MFLIEEEGDKKLKVECHFGRKKRLASIRTACSHVQNLITGVTKGFEYKMRLVYAHFPINISIEQKGAVVEVRNFLGEKRVRVITMLPGVTIARSDAVKDEVSDESGCGTRGVKRVKKFRGQGRGQAGAGSVDCRRMVWAMKALDI